MLKVSALMAATLLTSTAAQGQSETPEHRMKRKMTGALVIYGNRAKPVVERCLRSNKIRAGVVNYVGGSRCMDAWIRKQGYRPISKWGT
jgi:hypothetical protein